MKRLKRVMMGIVKRIRAVSAAVFGPPLEALWRLLVRQRDRFDSSLTQFAAWWARLFGKAPDGSAPSEAERPDRTGVLALTAAVMGALWFLPDWVGWFDLDGTTATLGAIGAWIAARVMVGQLWRGPEPQNSVQWWAAEVGHRTGLVRLERVALVSAVATIAVGAAIARGDIVAFGIAGSVGMFWLLIQPHDVRQHERWAPPLPSLPDGDEPPPQRPSGLEREFRWSLPLEMARGTHSLLVPIDEAELVAARAANPMSGPVSEDENPWPHWVDHPAEVVRWTAHELRRIAVEAGYSSFGELQNIVSFAQSIQYVTDEESTGHREYFKYAIETMADQEGDCDDVAILAAALLRRLGHGVAMLLIPPGADSIDGSGHVAVGVAAPPGTPGTYYHHAGIDYFFAETTAEGAVIGWEPPDTGEVFVHTLQ